MYPGQTHSFIYRYEEAEHRPFGYLLVDLKTTNKGNCRLRTNAFPGEEKFDQGGMQYNISQELLQYLKQQNLVTPPVLPAMQQLRNNLDGLLTRKDLGENEKARKYVQLQNDFLTFQHQLNSRNQEPEAEGKKSNLPTSIQEPVIDITAKPSSSASGSTSDPIPCASGDTRDSIFQRHRLYQRRLHSKPHLH